MALICTPDNLSDLAKCFSCLSSEQLKAIQTYLLCQIANNGGGGGGGSQQVLSGSSDDPNSDGISPDNTALAAIYYKDDADDTIMWCWSVSGQVWRQFIG